MSGQTETPWLLTSPALALQDGCSHPKPNTLRRSESPEPKRRTDLTNQEAPEPDGSRDGPTATSERSGKLDTRAPCDYFQPSLTLKFLDRESYQGSEAGRSRLHGPHQLRGPRAQARASVRRSTRTRPSALERAAGRVGVRN